MGRPEDLRRYKRLDTLGVRLNATLAIVDGNEVWGCLVPVKDFSKSGAGVYLKEEVDKGCLVRLSLEGLDYAPIEGKVVWISSSTGDPHAPASYPFRAGIDFAPKDDHSRENQLAVYGHVSKLVGEQE